jgi:ribosomal protein S2
VSKEASSVKIPIIALVDSNVKTHLYNLPIVSNDDSIESIGFMNNIISHFIIQSKYKNVLI